MASKGKAAAAKAVTIKLVVPAGKAAPAPPVGPALGQRGVKAIDFCKQFNDRTKHLIPGTPTPCRITVNPDRTFSFVTKSPPTGWLLKKAAGIEKGAARPGEEVAATLSVKHIYEIAKIKQVDKHGGGKPLEVAARAVAGQCRSIGIKVVP
ncbi:mitochondrial ribosomal protein L11 [Hyaloraphidium curvatum]|nr:mitochondrial ribosomal protein L11 [Hyaloraphidium curvatum]